jgi:enoyl-CoA hydratase
LPPLRGLRETLDVLRLPAAAESLSPLLGDGVLLVDLARERLATRVEEEALERALAHLPCPSIAIGVESAAGSAFDVVVADREALERVVEAVVSRPIASLALVQLLRRGESRGTHEALLDESLVYSTLQSGPEFGEWLGGRRPRKAAVEFSGPPVRAERNGDVLTLTLDRPEKRNAFSAEMRDALCEALEVAVVDADVASIVLRGEGRAFCSGGDLDEFGTLPDPATAHVIRSTRHVARLLDRCAARTTAWVHGACIGAGMELPAFCGQVVADPDARFLLPEVAMGLVPGAGGTCSIPRRIGRQRCAWLALTGAAIDAQMALAWGLVDEVRNRR